MSSNEKRCHECAGKVIEVLNSKGSITTEEIYGILGLEFSEGIDNVTYVYSADHREIRPAFEEDDICE